MKCEYVRTEIIASKSFVGKSLRTTLVENKTGVLWGSFMPRRKEIENVVGAELYSIEIYDDAQMHRFTPETPFTKWAAVSVSTHENVPVGLETLTIPEGLYAVFIYTGRHTEFASAFQYIFQNWLPTSPFQLDNRPHFEVMGARYKNDAPDSEEEIWIPIKHKTQ
ncbi:GyrI-like domain-containing protein [Pseudochryseolinea flava]|uniref:GyrI-like domain-containing protein n=1 Tax=Pseudochryseolinea flava TaxID=2059302 RepID=A0A364XZB6_9BACT|nr:GyrI-like domain-containing protein [Pseudochryseolinea flava]RAV98946.1 GyrI-like domain-containing protein [Pseudochryseolinea flava]